MTAKMKIAMIAGSNRENASSTELTEYAAAILKQQGHQVTVFDLYRKPLPFYSPDASFAGHESVRELNRILLESDAIALATPEYHGSLSGVLKNALDHLSQEHFGGKAVLSMSSAGGEVGVSSLQQLQAIVRNLHGINSPEWISLGGSQRLLLGQPGGEGARRLRARIGQALDCFVDLAARTRTRKEDILHESGRV